MFRLLFWIALIAAAYWCWRNLGRATRREPPTEQEPAAMVRCAHCRLHLPRDQAIARDGAWYCSRAHAERGPQPRGD